MPSALRHASVPDGADLPAIRCAIMMPTGTSGPDPGVADLIDLIQTRYHQTHRREFPEAIALARKVEDLQAAEPECPRSLADHLALMFDHLVSHHRREEQVLFPLILSGGSPLARFPIARMMAEHVDVDEQLVRLRTLTHDYSCPPGACDSWRVLSQLCRKLDTDLREHMRLEDEELFQPFLS